RVTQRVCMCPRPGAAMPKGRAHAAFELLDGRVAGPRPSIGLGGNVLLFFRATGSGIPLPRRIGREKEWTMTDTSALVREAREELARFPALLDGMVDGLSPARWRARPAPGEWSAVEIVCHLRDEEAEDFGARIRVLLDGSTRFTAIDPEGWATARSYHATDPI